MTREEVETIIRWDKTNSPGSFYTADRGEAKKLERVGLRAVEVDKGPDGKPRGWTFDVPRSWLRVRVRPKRQLSETQREKLRERLQQARASRRVGVA